MLTITVPKTKLFNEETSTFIYLNEDTVLELEHSLASIAKWERKWHKPYLSKDPRTREETIDYIRCMTLNTVDSAVYAAITDKQIMEINAYIEDPMTAATFKEEKSGKVPREFITNETIYYWMTVSQIPFSCDQWHFNALMALIRMCSAKNNTSNKKMSTSEVLAANARQNAKLRAELEALENESK